MAFKENYPSKLLEEAVEAISSLPGVGRRSALRLALHLLKQPQENVHHFASSIVALRDDVCYCRECRMISDDEVCSICADNSRDRNLICVVESVRDVMSIENTGQYHGVYHVLGGIISPINGVGPSDLTIRELVNRVQAVAPLKDVSAGSDSLVESGSVASVATVASTAPAASVDSTAPAVEILLALSGDVEGETTAFYIYRQLAPYNVKVTSLARGLGFGDDLEYADELTLGRSIINRQVFKP